jgi:hypothetical protein
MADALVPYAPLNVLKPVAENVWIADGPEIRMRVGFFGVPFPTRMTLLRLPGGDLWLHSPIAPDAALVRQVSALGPLRFLIAPNNLHYWWIADWKDRFPQAEVFAAPGVARAARRPMPAHRTLGADPPPAWMETIDQVLIEGDVLGEVDFFHRPSRTLVLTDLVENFELPRVRNRLMRWLVRLGGAADPDGKTPRDMQWSFLRSRDAVRAAVRQMIAWQPEIVIVAHGRWYEKDGAAELRRAFRWIL